MPKTRTTISPVTGAGAVAKSPNWTTLAGQPVIWIEADNRINTDIDANGIGRVQVKPGYDANLSEIRYDVGRN